VLRTAGVLSIVIRVLTFTCSSYGGCIATANKWLDVTLETMAPLTDLRSRCVHLPPVCDKTKPLADAISLASVASTLAGASRAALAPLRFDGLSEGSSSSGSSSSSSKPGSADDAGAEAVPAELLGADLPEVAAAEVAEGAEAVPAELLGAAGMPTDAAAEGADLSVEALLALPIEDLLALGKEVVQALQAARRHTPPAGAGVSDYNRAVRDDPSLLHHAGPLKDTNNELLKYYDFTFVDEHASFDVAAGFCTVKRRWKQLWGLGGIRQGAFDSAGQCFVDLWEDREHTMSVWVGLVERGDGAAELHVCGSCRISAQHMLELEMQHMLAGHLLWLFRGVAGAWHAPWGALVHITPVVQAAGQAEATADG
jgi:hypothetical protein